MTSLKSHCKAVAQGVYETKILWLPGLSLTSTSFKAFTSVAQLTHTLFPVTMKNGKSHQSIIFTMCERLSWELVITKITVKEQDSLYSNNFTQVYCHAVL